MTRRIADAQSSLADQLQQLEAEKISLMKRLNMVLSELEKATHEKSDIGGRLRQQETLAEELKKKLEFTRTFRCLIPVLGLQCAVYQRRFQTCREMKKYLKIQM